MLYNIQQINPQKSPKSPKYKLYDCVSSNEQYYNKHLITRNFINTTFYNVFTTNKSPKIKKSKLYDYVSSN